MAKRILVTGAQSFIGRHTLQPLVDAGFEVTGITRNREFLNLKDLPIIDYWSYCNLLNPEEVKTTISAYKPEYLLHLAWDVTPGYKNNFNNLDWMNASLNLIHQFDNYGGRKVVIAGTCFDHNATTLYGICKRSLWNILNYADFTKSLELSYGRIYYLYGPYEFKNRLIPVMINGLLDNEIVKIKSSGLQTMNLTYVQDVADAFVRALDEDVQGEFDILGKDTSIREIADIITDLLNMDSDRISLGTENLWESTIIPYDLINCKKLSSVMKTPLIRGLTKTIKFWELQRFNKEKV